MDCTLEEYIDKVKEQLFCNADDEYKSKYIVYNYTNEQVEENVEYFKQCLEYGLSPYKALLFFNDFLNGLSTCVTENLVESEN